MTMAQLPVFFQSNKQNFSFNWNKMKIRDKIGLILDFQMHADK